MGSFSCLFESGPGEDYFAPCFREIALNGVILLLVLKCSAILIINAFAHRAKSSLPHRQPLLSSHGRRPKHYGSVELEDDVTESLEVEEQLRRLSLFNVARLITSVLECALFACAISSIMKGNYEIDPIVESNRKTALTVYSIQAIFYLYALILSGTIVVSTNKRLADTMCTHLNWMYACGILISLVNIRSFYIIRGQDITYPGYKTTLISGLTALLLLAITIHEERHKLLYNISNSGRIKSTEFRSSLYSRFTFGFVGPMLKRGYRHTLNDEDLHELPKQYLTKYALIIYRKRKHTKLVFSLLSSLQQLLFQQFVATITWCVSMFGPPFTLNKIIKYIEQPNGNDGLTPYIYVLAMFIAATIQSLSHEQIVHIGRCMSMNIQSIVIGEVYSKALRRRQQGTSSANTENDEGNPESNVNNLLSVDANKMGQLSVFIPFIYAYVIQLSICTFGLYRLLGPAALYGVAIMILSQPVIYKLNTKLEARQAAVMGCTDKRIKLITELLNSIRVVKFFAWENEFRKRINEAREVELKATRSQLFMFVLVDSSWLLVTVIIMVTVFYIYTISHLLTPSTAFTVLALFTIFKVAIDDLPYMTISIVQGYVSLKRVEQFLHEEEIEPVSASASWESSKTIGFINDASYSWDTNSRNPIIKNLNLTFPPQKLSIICGPTGSGKSTLLSSLLGETYCHTGSAVLPRNLPGSSSLDSGGAVSGIAYVAQTAWLQNCSIRDNILFGLPYDQERYEKVIYMTALLPDLDILEFGDQTEVGERGITLSGGQKQRVAIARAVYSQADTIIFDDCLSAVDAHTAKHLYEHCLTGEFLNNRTVILVTHHVSLCINSADYVVALKDGEVAAAGKPKDVIATGVLGDEISHSDDEENSTKSSITFEESASEEKKSSKSPVADGGKLIKEEQRAKGGISWKVYSVYFYASGGFLFWIAVMALFGLSQATIIAQDVWIKVWSTASMEGIDGVRVDAILKADYISKYTATNSYYVSIYMLIGFFALITFTLRLVTLFTGSLRASRRIHAKLLDTILSARVRFFDTTPIGQIINRFSSDIQTIDQDMSPILSGFLYSLVAIPFVVALIVYAIPLFLIPGTLIAALFCGIGVYYLNTSRDMKRIHSVSRSPIYVQFHETINGVATIRAFGCQRRFIEEICKKVDDNNRPFNWMWTVNRWMQVRVDVLSALVSLVTGGGLLLSLSSIDAGLAGLALSNSLMFTRLVIVVVCYYAVYELNCNSVERIQEYLDIEKEAPPHIDATCPPPSWPETGSVKVDQLVMKYAPENPPVLQGISFETRPKEKVGIVGRTGSGKSTLALSLFRFMEATSGSIKVDGVDISQLGLHDLRSRITIIPQDPILFSGTLRSNLDPFGEFNDADLYVALRRSHLIRGDEDITLDTPVAENGSNWSQGQRQLIALARALVKRSSLIVLDEATSSVDFDTDQRIQETIRSELFADSSILCIAHRLRTVVDYDRILVLDQGKIVEFDTPYALMMREDGLFRQMCERSGDFQELLAVAQQKDSSST